MLKQGEWIIKEAAMFFITDYIVGGIKLIRVVRENSGKTDIKIFIGPETIHIQMNEGSLPKIKEVAIRDLEKIMVKILDEKK